MTLNVHVLHETDPSLVTNPTYGSDPISDSGLDKSVRDYVELCNELLALLQSLPAVIPIEFNYSKELLIDYVNDFIQIGDPFLPYHDTPTPAQAEWLEDLKRVIQDAKNYEQLIYS